MKTLTITAISFLLVFGCSQKQNQDIPTHVQVNRWALTQFEKVDSINPILSPSPNFSFDCPLSGHSVLWEERNVLNPSAVVKDNQVYLLYRAQDASGTSRIGIAVSSDGLHFEKNATPIFYPDNDSMKVYEWNYRKLADENLEECNSCYFDGVEDPRIVETEEGTYVMTYTSYDGRTARLSLATSKDLMSWTKHGLVFKNEKYRNNWSKSGAIITRQVGNKIVASRIDGKYWMYFGDTDIFIAMSDDLINWEVSENEENQKMISVLHPRTGYFDSRLVEPGPFALVREEGILLIYNGSNAANFNDSSIPRFTYSAGQALFDIREPYKLIDRTSNSFLHPDKEYEKTGEVNEVCFVEGLVYFQNKWFLYYGTADSRIAVAVME